MTPSDFANSLSIASTVNASLVGPAALGVVLLLVWALFAVLDARKTKLAVQRYERRTGGFLGDLERSGGRLAKASAFYARYRTDEAEEPRDLGSFWGALERALEVDRELIRQDDEAFAEAIAYCGHGLVLFGRGQWRVVPPKIYMDLVPVDGSTPTPIDLALLVGDMFEKNSIAQDKAIFELVHDDIHAD